MTCIEKLRELHPEWDEYRIQKAIDCDCPHVHIGIDIADCELIDCEDCWNRIVDGVHIPREFEYVLRDPPPLSGKLRRFVKIIDKDVHHYTGERIYKTLVFNDDGSFGERYYFESELLRLLKMRVGG